MIFKTSLDTLFHCNLMNLLIYKDELKFMHINFEDMKENGKLNVK